jgi:hypothetical protein
MFNTVRDVGFGHSVKAASIALGLTLSISPAHGQSKRFPPVNDPDAAALLDRAEKDMERAISSGPAFLDSSFQ